MTLCKSQKMGQIIVLPSRPAASGVILARIWWGRLHSTTWNHAHYPAPPVLEEMQEKGGSSGSPPGTSPSSSPRPSSEDPSFGNPSPSPSPVSPGLLCFPPLARTSSVPQAMQDGAFPPQLVRELLARLCGQGLVGGGGAVLLDKGRAVGRVSEMNDQRTRSDPCRKGGEGCFPS